MSIRSKSNQSDTTKYQSFLQWSGNCVALDLRYGLHSIRPPESSLRTRLSEPTPCDEFVIDRSDLIVKNDQFALTETKKTER